MKRLGHSEPVSTTLATPIGRLAIVASGRGVVSIGFAPRTARGKPAGTAARPETSEAKRALQHLAAATRQLRDYFAGRRSAFDLPLDLTGTAFQKQVWRALQRIPFGQTLTYGEVAARLGRSGSARAVGRACATNPAPVVVPCHRVVGGNGTLVGYDGGLWRKQKLLGFEEARH